MSHTTTPPTYAPLEITIGTTLEWEKDFDDFPADGWIVTYYFRGAGPGFDVVGTADGETHVFTVPAATTTNMTAGRYDYQAIAVKGSEKHMVDEGQTTAKASLAALTTSQTYDGRTQAKQILDAIDNLMKGKSVLDQQRYLIATGVPGFSSQREAERIAPSELLKMRDYYAGLVRSERRKNKSFKSIEIQFDRP